MSNVSTQKHIIGDVESVKYITGALRDISAIELKGLRDRFLRNGMFYDELRGLYRLVWRIAEESKSVDILSQRGKGTLYVAYTTNRHFYGSLNYDVMKALVNTTDTKDSCLIIGSTGKEIWRTAAKKRKEVSFLLFADDMPNEDEVRAFLTQVASYAHVHIMYPGFVSVYKQTANSMDITFRPDILTKNQGNSEEFPQYFLEPDLGHMVAFFNTQVRYMLFERILLETQLSRVAARLVRMDSADHNASDMLRHERRELRRAYSSFSNSRMLETLVGYIQWHNTTT